jgi:hypothetical protein
MGYRTLKMTLNKASGENEPEAYRLFHPPNPEPAKTGSILLGTLIKFFEPRAQFGKRRVLARLGCGGCNQVIFSILG